MKKGEVRRQQIVEHLADYILAHGLQGASLRPLAAAAGTSDRMLLHYFVDKEEVLTATLQLVTQRLVALLASVRADQQPFDQLLPLLVGMLQDPHIQPYMRLWLELVSLAASQQEPFGTIARQIGATLLQWIAEALAVEQEQEREALAAFTLVIVEGCSMFHALGDSAMLTHALAGAARYQTRQTS